MKLDWDLDGERLYEIGTDRGVVYPFNEDTKVYETGYAWNGLTEVDESPSGGEVNSVYANNGKYLNNRSDAEFSGTINAYTYPEEFELCDGTAVFGNTGVKVHQQKRKKFAFSYRSRIGNDIEGEDYGYKIHLFYNCMASPSSKSMETVNSDPNAATFSWELTTTPIEIDGMKRSAHIIIDSRAMEGYRLQMLEDMLYGTEFSEPKMPTIEELRYLYPESTLYGPDEIMSFSNGAPNMEVKKLTVALEPEQDLNGYDKPWAAGAGKNLLQNNSVGSTTKYGITFTKRSDGTVTANGTNDGEGLSEYSISISLPAGNYYFTVGSLPNGGASTLNASIWCETDSRRANKWDGTTQADMAWLNELYEVQIEDGKRYYMILYVRPNAVANNVVFKPMICASTETDSTFAPYENVCPIYGHDSATVMRTGFNVWDEEWEKGAYNINTGNKNLNPSTIRTKNFISCLPVTNYYVGTKFDLPAAVFYFAFYDENKTFLGTDLTGRYNRTITTPDNAHYLTFWIGSTAYPVTTNECGAYINYPSAETAYHEYQGDTYTVQFGQTVYGGTLDFTMGQLTVNWIGKMLTGNDIQSRSSAPVSTGDYRFYTTSSAVSGIEAPILNSDPADLLCNLAPTVAHTSTDYGVSVNRLDHRIYFNIKGCGQMTLAEFQAWVDANGVQLAYKLTTPTAIQLTPHQLKTLAGTNHIWCDAGDITELTYYTNDSINTLALNGDKSRYDDVMKDWFDIKRANEKTPAELTALCEEWYDGTRNGWNGTVTFAQPDSDSTGSSLGTKGGDNAGLVCIPSTATEANQDDYAGIPLFACKKVNWVLDETDGHRIITAIDGITDNYVQDDPETYVGMIQMAGYHYWSDAATTYTHGYTDTEPTDQANYTILPEAKYIGGQQSFVVHSKYMANKTASGKMTSCSGVTPLASTFSHNALVTAPEPNGDMYSGGSIVDISFLILMAYMKYGSLTQDGLNHGCLDYNYQYIAAHGEENVSRVLLTASQADHLIVGSTVLVGVYNGSSKGRDVKSNQSFTGRDGAVIASIETVTVDGVSYKAVNLDCEPFTTVGDGTEASGNTILSTWHWKTGTNDDVLGNDGAHAEPGVGRYPAMIQGIEYSVGGYEVAADIIMSITDSVCHSFIAKRKEYQATSITGNMAESPLTLPMSESAGWKYIRKLGYDGEMFFAIDTNGASGKYTKDAFYESTSGNREFLAFGYLGTGVGLGGLSFVGGTSELSYASWALLARLSPNGNRE